MKLEHFYHRLFLVLFTGSVILAIGMLVWVFGSVTKNSPSKLHSLITPAPTPDTELTVAIGYLQFSTPSSTLAKKPSLDIIFANAFSAQKKQPLDAGKVSAWLETIAPQINHTATPPAILARNSKVKPYTIFPGAYGSEVDVEKTTQTIVSSEFLQTTPYVLTLKTTGTQLSEFEIATAEKRVQAILSKSIKISIDGSVRTLTAPEILPLVSPISGFSKEHVQKYIATLSKATGTQPIEPELIIENNEVKKFTPPRDGKTIDEQSGTEKLIESLEKMETSKDVQAVELPLILAHPKKSLASTNTLGISERIGIGTSSYSHSIPNRIHNVALTAQTINWKLVMPGEEFSFNKYLGDVSAKTGFKQAYVIKDGQTVLGDGGGVCQVSSTLFRGILDAGLPVTERKGHSYRVTYYEQNSKPGFDATVYAPHPDLRFFNDTGTPILVNAVADSKNLMMYVELYGKSDGRKAEIVNYKQWGAQPAPPPLYQDDPTLGPGKIKQIDYASPGLKTSFDYVVTYPNGEKKTKTFSTNYIPWRAVYLRGI